MSTKIKKLKPNQQASNFWSSYLSSKSLPVVHPEIADETTATPNSVTTSNKVTVLNPDNSSASVIETEITQPKKPSISLTPQDQLCSHRVYKFQEHWLETFKWLVYEPTINGLLCMTCREALQLKLIRENKNAFTSSGFRSWKKGRQSFQSHEQSCQHIEAVAKLNALQKPSIAAVLDTEYQNEQQIARTALKCIISSLKYLGKQGIPVQGHTSCTGNFMQLLYLRKSDITELESLLKREKSYTSHDIQNEILKLIAFTIQRKHLTQIKECHEFSIIVDETTDIATCEQVSLNIRYVTNNLEPRELFMGLYQTSSTTGEMLEGIILDSLTRFGLSLNNLRGQCYDGASNMSGIFKGVQARIMEKEPKALYVHCFNHCLNLALQDTAKAINHLRDCMHWCHELGTIVHRSPKRMEMFSSLASDVDGKVVSPRTMCPTRWTMRIRSINPVLENYDIMLDFLHNLSESPDDISPKAKGLYNNLNNGAAYFGILLCKELFEPTERLSKVLQSPSSTITGSYRAVLDVVDHFKSMQDGKRFEELWNDMQIKIEELDLQQPTLPRKRKIPSRFKDCTVFQAQPVYQNPKEKYRDVYCKSLDLLITELLSRFDQPGIHRITELEKILIAQDTQENNYFECLRSACQTYGLDEDSLKTQLRMFKKHSTNCINLDQICTQFKELDIAVQKLYPDIKKLIKILIVVPASGANSERSFSMLRRIKTYLRSTMGQARLNHLCVLNAYPEDVDSTDVDAIANDFVNSNYRVTVFGPNEVLETE